MKRFNKFLASIILAAPFFSSCGGGSNEPVDVYGPGPYINGNEEDQKTVYGPGFCEKDADCSSWGTNWVCKCTFCMTADEAAKEKCDDSNSDAASDASSDAR